MNIPEVEMISLQMLESKFVFSSSRHSPTTTVWATSFGLVTSSSS